MDEQNQEPDEALEKTGEEAEAASSKPEHHSPLEPVYRNIDVPIKYVDIFIGLCVAALILVVVVGVLKGNKII